MRSVIGEFADAIDGLIATPKGTDKWFRCLATAFAAAVSLNTGQCRQATALLSESDAVHADFNRARSRLLAVIEIQQQYAVVMEAQNKWSTPYKPDFRSGVTLLLRLARRKRRRDRDDDLDQFCVLARSSLLDRLTVYLLMTKFMNETSQSQPLQAAWTEILGVCAKLQAFGLKKESEGEPNLLNWWLVSLLGVEQALKHKTRPALTLINGGRGQLGA